MDMNYTLTNGATGIFKKSKNILDQSLTQRFSYCVKQYKSYVRSENRYFKDQVIRLYRQIGNSLLLIKLKFQKCHRLVKFRNYGLSNVFLLTTTLYNILLT